MSPQAWRNSGNNKTFLVNIVSGFTVPIFPTLFEFLEFRARRMVMSALNVDVSSSRLLMRALFFLPRGVLPCRYNWFLTGVYFK
jgi:hypothetical protein